jgi:hypothetical protein
MSKAVAVLPDGTRVYRSGHTYRPQGQRLNGVRQPDDPRAVRFHARWFLPLALSPDAEREMPETRPDDDAYEHMSRTLLCNCDVCRRPEAERFRRRWRRDHGLRP